MAEIKRLSTPTPFELGWQSAISSIRASLIDYPHAGGDSGIMLEVERLLQEARTEAYREGSESSDLFWESQSTTKE